MSDGGAGALGRLARAALRLGLPAMIAGAATLAIHLGWARPSERRARPWREATGWLRLDAPTEPASAIRVGDDPDPLRLLWLGHSGFLVEWHGTRLLLDPNLSPRCTVAPRLLERPVTPAELGPVDAALVSHAHRDHLDLPTLEALAGHGGLPLLALPAGAEGYAASLARRGVRTVGVPFGEALAVGPLEAIPVPALHGGARSHPLASGRPSAGWVIRARDGSGSSAALYFAGDTGYSRPLFRSIGERYRPALAILPIGAHAPAWPIGRVHLSPEQAARAALDLSAGGEAPVVVPCHFGTFVLSLDRPDAALPRFSRAAREAGLDWRMPALLGAGAGAARTAELLP